MSLEVLWLSGFEYWPSTAGGPKFVSQSLPVGLVVDKLKSGQAVLGDFPIFPCQKFHFTIHFINLTVLMLASTLVLHGPLVIEASSHLTLLSSSVPDRSSKYYYHKRHWKDFTKTLSYVSRNIFRIYQACLKSYDLLEHRM